MDADMPSRHPLQKYEGNKQERRLQANRVFRKANPERARELSRRWKQQRGEMEAVAAFALGALLAYAALGFPSPCAGLNPIG